jgi:hypothetical protein
MRSCAHARTRFVSASWLRAQYGEFRRGYKTDGVHDAEDTRLVFAGMPYIVASYLERRWTADDVEEAARFFMTHDAGGTPFPFPRHLFDKFVAENDGACAHLRAEVAGAHAHKQNKEGAETLARRAGAVGMRRLLSRAAGGAARGHRRARALPRLPGTASSAVAGVLAKRHLTRGALQQLRPCVRPGDG